MPRPIMPAPAALLVLAAAANAARASAGFQRTSGSVVNGCCAAPGSSGKGATFAGNTTTQAACEALCAASRTCSSYTWHSAKPAGAQEWALSCYLRADGAFALHAEAGIFSGRKAPSSQAPSHYTPDWCEAHPLRH